MFLAYKSLALVETLSGADVIVSLASGVKINDANVILADVEADNGVAHVLDKVLLESFLGLNETSALSFNVYPNPAQNEIQVAGTAGVVSIADMIVEDVVGGGHVSNGGVVINVVVVRISTCLARRTHLAPRLAVRLAA